MAKKIKKATGYSGGKEGQMSVLGMLFLVFGIIGFIVCFYVSGEVTKTYYGHSWGDNGFSPIWIVFGVTCLVQGIGAFIILTAGAEIIRLLKKLNGLNYGGKISEPEIDVEFTCSDCGGVVAHDSRECRACEKKFEQGVQE